MSPADSPRGRPRTKHPASLASPLLPGPELPRPLCPNCSLATPLASPQTFWTLVLIPVPGPEDPASVIQHPGTLTKHSAPEKHCPCTGDPAVKKTGRKPPSGHVNRKERRGQQTRPKLASLVNTNTCQSVPRACHVPSSTAGLLGNWVHFRLQTEPVPLTYNVQSCWSPDTEQHGPHHSRTVSETM